MTQEDESQDIPGQENGDLCKGDTGAGTSLVRRGSRVIFLLAVIGSALLAVALFIYGFAITIFQPLLFDCSFFP